ncbi:MAG: GTP-binding protein, partial [Deltaproteobacteria bacterium]
MSTETARPAGLEAEVVEHDQLLVRQALAGDAAAGGGRVAPRRPRGGPPAPPPRAPGPPPEKPAPPGP